MPDARSTTDAGERSIPPEASLDPCDARSTVGETCEFDGRDSQDPDGELREHVWAVERDDRVVGGDTGPTFAWTFDRPGTYEVHLTVTDEDGLWDTDTAAVEVEEAAESAGQ